MKLIIDIIDLRKQKGVYKISCSCRKFYIWKNDTLFKLG
jgi:hypothetical protein